MNLLHPPISPWIVCHADGCDIVLLTGDAEVSTAFLRSMTDNESELVELRQDGSDGALTRWRGFLPWDRGNPTTRYAFKVIADGRQRWLAADGMHGHVPPEGVHFRVHPSETPPEWVREQIFYQIFPDRFSRSGQAADITGKPLFGSELRSARQAAWGEQPDPAHAANTFYGGDLPGIRQRLDYLQQELGVTALYLNPVFLAGSNHRYNTENYFQVCQQLGGNSALQALCEDLRSRGMRLLLDAVVNHTGTNHPWFNQWSQHATIGAAQSPASPWRSFYAFDAQGKPIGWKGHASLPVLDFSSEAVQEAVYAGPDAILRHWLRPPYAIDGWRLDVIHMLGEGAGSRRNGTHVRAMRRAVREENVEAYVLGEHFAEATHWLQGDQEDGAMNYYGFGFPVRSWLLGSNRPAHPESIDTADFARWLLDAQATIPYANQLAQLNLLDSHDTARLLTLLDGDIARMQLAAVLLFAMPGVPCIYYGDEVGLEGGEDPDCRRCFPWERSSWNQALFEHYRSLARLRTKRAEWRDGAYLSLYAQGDVFVFARFNGQSSSIVAVNRGDETAVDIQVTVLPGAPTIWHDLAGQEQHVSNGHLHLALPTTGWRIVTAR